MQVINITRCSSRIAGICCGLWLILMGIIAPVSFLPLYSSKPPLGFPSQHGINIISTGRRKSLLAGRTRDVPLSPVLDKGGRLKMCTTLGFIFKSPSWQASTCNGIT
jgi:hypothetical protein